MTWIFRSLPMRALRAPLLVVAAAAVVLILVGCAQRPSRAASTAPQATGTIVPGAADTGPSDKGTVITEISVFPGGRVWARTEDGLLRTDDGGGAWMDITPSELQGEAPSPTVALFRAQPAAFFLDASQAWLATFPNTPGPAPATVLGTVDGGRTWGSQQVELEGEWPADQFTGGGAIFFLDENRGWLMAKLGGSSASSRAVLYRTDDGGETWTKVSIPFAGTVRFTSPTDGWVAGGAAKTRLAATHDGGVTWDERDVPRRSDTEPWLTTVAAPHFSDQANGVLPVQVLSDTSMDAYSNLYFYVTQDGGSSWAAAGPPLRVPHTGVLFAGDASKLAFSDAGSWYLMADHLYVSRDAGGTWDAVEAAEAPGYVEELAEFPVAFARVRAIQFPTVEEGWAYWRQDTCLARGDCAAEVRLLKTQDGGRTWEEVSLP